MIKLFKTILVCLIISVFSPQKAYGQTQEVTQVIDSIAQLVQNPVNTSRKTFIALGRFTKGDGGGGLVTYDAASSATTNSTGVFAPTSGSGRWIISNGNFLNSFAYNNFVRADYYHEIRVVSTTISNSLTTISSTPDHRVAVLVPAGIYNEYNDLTKDNLAWVDIIGVNRDTVTNSFSGDAGNAGIIFMSAHNMVANMTIEYTSSSGSGFPIHIDNDTDSTNAIVGVTMVVNCNLRSLGANANAGIGLEFKAGQTIVLANNTIYSAKQEGINAHNETTSTSSSGYLYLLNNIVSTDATDALEKVALNLRSTGSTQPDQVIIRGGSYQGATAGILVTNNGSSDVIYCDIDDSVLASSIAFSDSTKRLNGVFGVPDFRNKLASLEYYGNFKSSPIGGWFINGDLTKINGLDYSWPTEQPESPLAFLNNDGSGNLTWEIPDTSSIFSLLGYTSYNGDFFVVGSGLGATHSTMQDAINDLDTKYNRVGLIIQQPGIYTNRFYNVGLENAQWVHIIGYGKDSVTNHFTDAGLTGTNDTATMMGRFVLANMTLRRTTTGGSADYALHVDTSSANYTNLLRSVWVASNLRLIVDGAGAGASVGIGMHSGEMGYLKDITAVGVNGIRAANLHDHNGSAVQQPSHLIISGGSYTSSGGGGLTEGLGYYRLTDNSVPSYIYITGISASNDSGGPGIKVASNTSSGESLAWIDDNVNATISVSPTNWLMRGDVSFPTPPHVQFTNEYFGTIHTGPNGTILDDLSLRPEEDNSVQRIYLAGPATNTFWGVPATGDSTFVVRDNTVFKTANSGTTLGVGQAFETAAPATRLHIVSGSTLLDPHPSISSTDTRLLVEAPSGDVHISVLSTNNMKSGYYIGDNNSEKVARIEVDHGVDDTLLITDTTGTDIIRSVPGTIPSRQTDTVLRVVRNGNANIEIVGGSANTLRLGFTGATANDGAITYNTSSDTMGIVVNGGNKLVITTSLFTFSEDVLISENLTVSDDSTFNDDITVNAATSLQGGIKLKRTATGINYTVLLTDHIIGCTANNITITLPSAVTAGAGKVYVVKDEAGTSGTLPITINATAGNIDGSSSVAINVNNASFSFYSNGSNWFIY